MQRSRKRNRRVLLLEPNYPNKYPPVGLMKLATYYRRLGWDVVFYKGEYDAFVVDRLTLALIDELDRSIPEVRWGKHYGILRDSIWKRKDKPLLALLSAWPKQMLDVLTLITRYQDEYKHGGYFERKEWERVGVTTLFTFYAKETIAAIEFAKKLVSPENIMVGGVMASLVPDYIIKTTGVVPVTGLLERPALYGDKVRGDVNIDDLPLDYSILEEIEYQYPASDAHFAHTTRGCVNKCAFCAVPVLEPKYKGYVALKSNIEYERRMFGARPNLLLMDNNVFASKDFPRIIDDIKKLGFARGDKIESVCPLKICEERVGENYNVRAYIKKGVVFLQELYRRIKIEQDKNDLLGKLLEYNADGDWHAVRPDEFLALCKSVRSLVDKYWKASRKTVSVDYNQGLDSRLSLKQGMMDKLAECAIKPVRIAFDHWELRKVYEESIRMAAKAGIRQMSNYVLYNFKDTPEELYWRLRQNVALCEELDVSIYSFPMKYHPIKEPKWFSNRNYLGSHWCRKYIRFVQVVLNSTMGKVGRGKPFFLKAFGENINDFRELMLMPEAYLLKRWDAELGGDIDRWRDMLYALRGDDLEIAKKLIVYNTLNDARLWSQYSDRVRDFMDLYLTRPEMVKVVSPSKRNKAIADYNDKWQSVSVRLGEAEISKEMAKIKDWDFYLDHPAGEV